MPIRLHHIVVDAHDLPGLARFWTQALGWKVLSERENEIVIGIDENAAVGMCFMPVTEGGERVPVAGDVLVSLGGLGPDGSDRVLQQSGLTIDQGTVRSSVALLDLLVPVGETGAGCSRLAPPSQPALRGVLGELNVTGGGPGHRPPTPPAWRRAVC